MLTVGQLRNRIGNQPDDIPVVIDLSEVDIRTDVIVSVEQVALGAHDFGDGPIPVIALQPGIEDEDENEDGEDDDE
jgi:hypothetical protein